MRENSRFLEAKKISFCERKKSVIQKMGEIICVDREKRTQVQKRKKRWGKLIENRVKEEKEIERIQDFKKEFFL